MANIPRVGRRVLVIDDNADTADTMVLLLQMSGHRAEAAYTGLAALERARSFEPEVGVLDLLLPDTNGHQVAQVLRNEQGGRPLLLIALSGDDSLEAKTRSESSGFDHHWIKPIENHVLLELLSKGP